ncbi:MAG: hypothetical protein KDB65_05575 [Calditrichaeota bacterium]|nr:hypothetical protein [Calditrichota bacterium]MCB9368118.1 hypothetical protein [Calditrichota bacterium]
MLILRILLSILLICAAVWAQSSRESDYLTRDYGKIAITYCPEDSSLVDPLSRDLFQRLPVISSRLHLSVPQTMRFVITPSADEWFRVTSGSPLWANGVAYPGHGVAVLKSPRFNMNGGPLAETAAHEMTHLLLDTGAEGGIPRWLDEGVAQFMAGQQEFMDVHVLARAAASGRLMSFWDIQGLLAMNTSDARQGYAQSLAAVQDLWARYGDSGIANLIHELREGRDIDKAFPTLFGMPLGQFEREHFADLREHYGGSIWSDGELWISLLFVILVLSAGTFAYLRRRRTLDKWRREQLHVDTSSPAGEVPYTVNYSIVRNRQNDDDENGPPHDRPVPGN